MTTATQRHIKLRYRATCSRCALELPAGTEAWWDRTLRQATCFSCDLEAPADPWATVDPQSRGVPGGSAEHEHACRNDRRPGSGESWRKGAEGEAELAGRLHGGSVKGQYEVLHDRVIPGTRANIDHIVIARAGIYVIDAKKYKGRIEQKVTGFGRKRAETLVVNGRDRTKLAIGMERQTATVADALTSHRGPTPNVSPVLCFVDGEWELFASPFTVAGVRVIGPRALVRVLSKDGPVGGTERAQLARLLAHQLPAAVSG